MTLTFSRKQRQLVFEKDMLEAEAIDPTGLFGTAKAILWPDRDAANISAQPPVVEPIIRVPIPAKPPPKGRTRSSNRAPVQAGEALVRPLNITAAEGISSLSGNEIALDLEIMGLSSRKLEDNWFYNVSDEVEMDQQEEEEAMSVDVPEDRKPVAKKQESQKPDMREVSVDDEYLLPKRADPQAPPAGYPPPAPYDYVWPPYADPRYPTSPHYHPYYPPPPPPADAVPVNFSFPSGSAKDPSARPSKAFSFPQARTTSYDGKEGHTRDDAIVIDDEQPARPVESSNSQRSDRAGVPRKKNGGQSSHSGAPPSYHAMDIDPRDMPPKGRVPVEAQQSKSLAPREAERVNHRYPANAYQREYQRGWTPEDPRYYNSSIHESPDNRSQASPPQQQDRHLPRERRVSGTEREHDYVYRATPEQSHRWAQQHASTRYRPYYEGGHLDAAGPQYGYPPEYAYDQWGRPIDPYPPAAYLHPTYTESSAEHHAASRRGHLPPPPDPYRDVDRRLHYRQYSAQTDEPFYPPYEASYAHSGAPVLIPNDTYNQPVPRRMSKTSADGDPTIRARYASTYSPQHR
ncbi:hypothetical protein P389DRAFT_103153 [Cystobasidium minutum MCA 4210]|uniref:uncharacterized protein n=1 Tax=Cystobasidium minutum MCA 4210 TaxID=1397322 RepID=UPI0034CDADF6|eukprot:jgi/Rhomi1/103153/CE103152_379